MFKIIVIMRCLRSMGLGCAIMGRRFVYRAFRTYGMFETLSSTRGESLRGARARHTGRNVVPERGAGRTERTSTAAAGLARAYVLAPLMISALTRPNLFGVVCPDRGPAAALVLVISSTAY